MAILYEFTPCGAKGRFGPTQDQVNSYYASVSSPLSGNVTSVNGIQEWTVPATGTYRIEAQGAVSGRNNTGPISMIGDFDLTAGQVLRILVGQRGAIPASTRNNMYAGGGGGTFVVNKKDNSPLIIAGGVGDDNHYSDLLPLATNGFGGLYGGVGGTSASGGGGGNVAINSSIVGTTGGGGGGFYGDGTPGLLNKGATVSAPGGGRSFSNGGAGGAGSTSDLDGGFGGGGGGGDGQGDSYNHYGGGGGGGGGYSGGGGGGFSYSELGFGGHGGCYNSGSNQSNNEYVTYYSNTGSYGDGFVRIALSQMPTTPTNMIPAGVESSPTIIRTLMPTLSWTLSDPVPGNSQSSVEFRVYKITASGLQIVQSNVLSTAETSFTFNTNLEPNTSYCWKTRACIDFHSSPNVSMWSEPQYFKTSQAPTVTNLMPNESIQRTCGPQPRFSWNYQDVEGDAQKAFHITIYDQTTGVNVFDSQIIYSDANTFDLPANVVTEGHLYRWNLSVCDSTDMWTYSPSTYFQVNTPPAAVTPIGPKGACRERPAFQAIIGTDVDHDLQNFKIQIADDSAFTLNLQEFSTLTSTTSWEVNNGTSWLPFPTGGVDATLYGKQVRYTPQNPFPVGNVYYWRMAPIDGVTSIAGAWSEPEPFTIDTVLQFKMKTPLVTSTMVKTIVISSKTTLPTDGAIPATLKVEVCNNGMDENPTWEDATAAHATGSNYSFQNTEKTAAEWAIDCRFLIVPNDSLGTIECSGIGFSYS